MTATGPAAHAVAAGRRAAEALMTDTCTVLRKATSPVVVDGRDTWPDSVVYTGPCRVRVQSAYPIVAEGAGHTYTTQQTLIHLPVSAPTVTTGDMITVAGYPHPLRVTGFMRATVVTAQRVVCSVESA